MTRRIQIPGVGRDGKIVRPKWPKKMKTFPRGRSKPGVSTSGSMGGVLPVTPSGPSYVPVVIEPFDQAPWAETDPSGFLTVNPSSLNLTVNNTTMNRTGNFRNFGAAFFTGRAYRIRWHVRANTWSAALAKNSLFFELLDTAPVPTTYQMAFLLSSQAGTDFLSCSLGATGIVSDGDSEGVVAPPFDRWFEMLVDFTTNEASVEVFSDAGRTTQTMFVEISGFNLMNSIAHWGQFRSNSGLAFTCDIDVDGFTMDEIV